MDGYVTIGTELDTKGFDKEIAALEYKLNDIKSTLQMADQDKTLFSTREVKEMEAEAQKLGRRIDGLKEKQRKLDTAGFSGMKESIDNVGKSVIKVTRRIVKMALAVFGVRSAYMLVRQSMSTLSQYDEQLATNIEYIRYLIASTLKPVIEGIVNLVYKLLAYINAIAKGWFGVNLFANANRKEFEKSKKAMAGTAKSAKELKKQLAGFDEMQVLSDNQTASGGGGGATGSQLNIPNIEDMPVPEWIKWIADNGDLVAGAIAGIATALVAVKLGLDAIEATGLGVIVAGVAMLIGDIIDMIKDPSWKNFATILGDIAIIVGGVLMIALNSWWGLLVAIVGLAVKLIAENWDKISGILGEIGKWILDNVLKPVSKFITSTLDTIGSLIKTTVSIIKGVFTTLISILTNPFKILRETVSGVFNGIKKSVEGVFKIIKGIFTADFKTVMDGFKDIFKGAFDALWSIAKAPINLIIGGLNALIKGVNKISFDVPDWVPGIGGQKWGFNIPQIPKLARGGIVNNPGPGVMMGSYIAGERGAEAVLPLTDDTLQRLANMIPITVNVTNTMNGRVISRELQKVQNESDFAFNR